MKPEIRLVGVTGLARAGKDTFAAVLRTRAGFKRVAVGDAVKEDLARLLDVTPDYIEEHKAELRLALQLRGTEFWRTRDPEHWISEADRRVNGVLMRGGKVVVPDIRFLNEADWIRRRGGVLVRMVRTEKVAPFDSHTSETEQDRIEVDREYVCKTGVHWVELAAHHFMGGYLDQGKTPVDMHMSQHSADR